MSVCVANNVVLLFLHAYAAADDVVDFSFATNIGWTRARRKKSTNHYSRLCHFLCHCCLFGTGKLHKSTEEVGRKELYELFRRRSEIV